MVKLIMGLKGSGKTKNLIELISAAALEEDGDIVCIEKGSKLTYDIPYKVRLIDASPYDFNGYDFFKGFISGLYCANYDITHIFIDSVLKIIGAEIDERTDEFLDWCEVFSQREGVKFTIMLSIDLAFATESQKKYLTD